MGCICLNWPTRHPNKIWYFLIPSILSDTWLVYMYVHTYVHTYISYFKMSLFGSSCHVCLISFLSRGQLVSVSLAFMLLTQMMTVGHRFIAWPSVWLALWVVPAMQPQAVSSRVPQSSGPGPLVWSGRQLMPTQVSTYLSWGGSQVSGQD